MDVGVGMVGWAVVQLCVQVGGELYCQKCFMAQAKFWANLVGRYFEFHTNYAALEMPVLRFWCSDAHALFWVNMNQSLSCQKNWMTVQ